MKFSTLQALDLPRGCARSRRRSGRASRATCGAVCFVAYGYAEKIAGDLLEPVVLQEALERRAPSRTSPRTSAGRRRTCRSPVKPSADSCLHVPVHVGPVEGRRLRAPAGSRSPSGPCRTTSSSSCAALRCEKARCTCGHGPLGGRNPHCGQDAAWRAGHSGLLLRTADVGGGLAALRHRPTHYKSAPRLEEPRSPDGPHPES